MAEAFIVRRGGGGSGGTLVVTSSGAGTVTVSNTTLGKSYSKTVTAGGSVTFKGLKTGTWTVTLSDGTQTVTKTVTINADYSTSIAYFSASISITYPATSTCVVTNSSGETVASDSNATSSAKTWTATVNATGTYTITATSTSDSNKTKSTTVTITADGQSVSVTLSYNLVLFDNGTDNTTVTGGWTTVKNNKLYVSAYVDGQGGNRATCESTNKIDLSEYNTIRFEGVTSTDSNGENRTSQVGVEGTYTAFDIVTNSTIDVDISKVSLAKVQIIAEAASYTGSDTVTVTVSRVVLL